MIRSATGALLLTAAFLGAVSSGGRASAQEFGAVAPRTVFGEIPKFVAAPKSASSWIFFPGRTTTLSASTVSPPTSRFTSQEDLGKAAISPSQSAILEQVKGRSGAFVPATAFVATAAPSPSSGISGVAPKVWPIDGAALAQNESESFPNGPHAEPPAFATRTSIVVSKSKNLRIPVPFADAAVGDADIADVVPISNRQLYVLGKKIGSTNVMLYDPQKRLIGVVDVDVQLDTSAMGEQLRQGVGAGGIRVADVNGNIVLSGTVSDGLAADRAMRVAAGMAPEGKNVVNNMSVTSPQQVMLQVRFVEADRQAVRNLGVRWNAFWKNYRSGAVVGQNTGTNSLYQNPGGGVTLSPQTIAGYPTSNNTVNNTPVPDAVSGGLSGLVGTASPFATILANLVNSKAGSLDVVLSALEDQQVVRRLAEPNLVALSGESADFLAGGEFPVPISSTTGVGGAPTVTIDYKEFGVRLKFTPTVLANGVVSLKLESEVSDLDPTIVVQTGGVAVPGISKRRASSTVELRDGQAFGIAGMLSAKSQRQLDAFPWLGTVPYLGALFSSKEFQQNETELVMLVSPHVVKPVGPNKKLKTPLDTSLAANDLDFFLQNKPEIPKAQPTYVTPNGHAQALDAGMAPGAPGVQEDPNRWHWPWETK